MLQLTYDPPGLPPSRQCLPLRTPFAYCWLTRLRPWLSALMSLAVAICRWHFACATWASRQAAVALENGAVECDNNDVVYGKGDNNDADCDADGNGDCDCLGDFWTVAEAGEDFWQLQRDNKIRPEREKNKTGSSQWVQLHVCEFVCVCGQIRGDK